MKSGYCLIPKFEDRYAITSDGEIISLSRNMWNGSMFKTGLMNPTGMSGGKNPASKLTTDQVLKIRELKGKATLKTTADKFGISVSQTWSIQNYKSRTKE